MADNYYSGVAVSLASRLLSIAASFAVIWAFNLLGREAYGVYAFAGSLVAIVIVLSCFGLDQLVLFRQSQDRAKPLPGLLGASLGRVARVSVAVCILYLLFGYVRTQYLEPSAHFPVFLALALTIPAMAGTQVYTAWHQAFQHFRKALLVPRITDVLRLLFLIPLGLLLPNIESFLLVIVVSAWVPLLVYRMDIGALPAGTAAIETADKNYARRMVLVRLIGSGVDNLAIILVGLMTTSALTAAFALGARIASFALLGNQLLAQVTLPRIGARLGQSDLAGMMSEFDRHRWISLLVALGVTSVLLLFGPGIVGLFGNYTDALPVLYALLSANIVASGFGPVGNALKMGGHASALLTSVWVFIILLLVTNLVFIPFFGIVGAAFATLASVFMVNLLNWWQCHKVYRLWTSGPLAFAVMLVSISGVFLFASGMTVPGISILGIVMIFAMTRILRCGQAMTKSVDCQ